MTTKQRRTKADKVGRRLYTIRLIKRLAQKIDEIDLRTRKMMAGLHDWMSFESNFIEELVCRDELDARLVRCLIEAGKGGISPKETAQALAQYGLKRWSVTRRIRRMNRKLTKEIGEKVAEKRGRRWAATSFTFKVWGLPKEEVKEELLEED
jgi:hypothetical protein